MTDYEKVHEQTYELYDADECYIDFQRDNKNYSAWITSATGWFNKGYDEDGYICELLDFEYEYEIQDEGNYHKLQMKLTPAETAILERKVCRDLSAKAEGKHWTNYWNGHNLCFA